MGEDSIHKNTLIYDLETKTFGKPDSSKDIMRIFACHSYIKDKSYLLTSPEQAQTLINAHKFLVGFNNYEYDNPILLREGVSLKYKMIIDLRKIFKSRASQMKIDKGMLGDLLMEYSLDYITRMLDIVTEEEAKLKIDYALFRKDTWTPEERKMIANYTRRDIEVTKTLYEWVENYFSGFKPFISEADVKKKVYLTASIAKFSYKAICKAMNWTEEYGTDNPEDERIGGGYVSYPAGEKYEGDIYCLDYNCFPGDTKIRMVDKSGNYYDKRIDNVKPGDKILNEDGVQIVGGTNSQYYSGKLLCIELENGKKVKCTPEHKFPIYRNNKEIVVEAKDLLLTDELITTMTKRGKKNPAYKNAVELKICEVCGTEFNTFKSQSIIKCCSTECSNILRRANNPKTNLGKTKFNTPHLMKMSKQRKGIPRTEQHKKNISKATKLAMKKVDMKKINKNRDMSFMKTIDWRIKVLLSKSHNIKNGKFRYKDINFRSNWEVMLAKNLDKNNIEWKYEPKFFRMSDGRCYLPDFYLPKFGKWIEVKGYMHDHSRKKIQEFMKSNDLILLNELNKIDDSEVKWLKSEV